MADSALLSLRNFHHLLQRFSASPLSAKANSELLKQFCGDDKERRWIAGRRIGPGLWKFLSLSRNAVAGLDLNFRVKQEETVREPKCKPHQHTQICLHVAVTLGFFLSWARFQRGSNVHVAFILKQTGELRIITTEEVSYISVYLSVVPAGNGKHLQLIYFLLKPGMSGSLVTSFEWFSIFLLLNKDV